MIVSLRLLKELINFDYSASELSQKLTSIGIEVEGIRKVSHSFEGIVTGKVLTVDRVKDTELFKANVDTKQSILSLITSATNLKENDIVGVAPIGSRISNGTIINKRDFMGNSSEGMLCSAEELGLENDLLSSEEKEGIFVLPQDTPIGLPVEEILPIDDELLDISLLPDRADAFYIVGLARWIEILNARENKRKADFSELRASLNLKEEFRNNFPVEISSTSLCPTYSTRIVKEVKIKKSSFKLRKELFLLRIRPINNVVDITNLVAKKYGQPLHAFDFDKLQGKIIVRPGKAGEKLKTLDGTLRNLNSNNLLITDLSGPIAIAGVMGGEATAVTEKTKNILIESAFFSPQVIARSSRSIGLITDASTLFEKGVDSLFQSEASKIAASLMKEEGKGKISAEKITTTPFVQNYVPVRYGRIDSYLGEKVSREEVKKYFDYEGFEYKEDSNKLAVAVPSFRQDIVIEEDLIEEVFRMKGYDKLEESMIVSPIRSGSRTKFENFVLNLKSLMVEYGLMEVSTVSLINTQLLVQTRAFNNKEIITILNPLSEDMNILRPCLFPTLSQVLKRNINVGVENIAIFELDKVFEKKSGTYKENTELALILKGDRLRENGLNANLSYNFFYLKGLIENTLEKLHIPVTFSHKRYPYLHPFQSASINVEGIEIGFLGRLSKDLDKDAYFASLNVDSLMNLSKGIAKFREFSLFPSVKRDIAVIVDDSIEEVEIRNAILEANIKELAEIKLFDLYKGPPLPPSKKNLAYSLEFSSNERTFKSEEIDGLISKIELSIKERVKGVLRKK